MRAWPRRLRDGPVAEIVDRQRRQNYPLRSRLAGLLTAIDAVALIRWLRRDQFGGPGMSLPALAILSLVIYLSFWVWRFGIRTPRLGF